MSRTRTITAEDLAQVIRRVATVPPLKRMGCSAEAYARLGLRVIPLHHPTVSGCSCGHVDCRDPGKHPRTSRGVKDATSDIETIRAWWFSHPFSNIGIATGYIVDVIDIDSSDACQAVADLLAAGRLPSVVAVAASGREEGGAHLYVAVTGAGCAKPPVAGLDYWGRGGYVVAAPSLHTSGTEYAWSTGLTTVGDPQRGRALEVMPWEEVVCVPQPGRREFAYALAMLSRQEQHVALAPRGSRIPRVLRAGNNLGSVVGAGWIREQHVTDVLLKAYQRANGSDERAARRAILDGLLRGRGLALPALGDPVPTNPHEVVDGIILWMNSPASRVPALTRGRVAAFDVLHGILERADRSGRTCVPVSVRDAQLWGGYASTSPAWKALKRLVAAGVMSEVEVRSRGAGTARRFRLHVPADARSTCGEGEQDTVGVSEDSNTFCVPRPQSQQVASHSLWGHRRGEGFGLTRTDRLLFGSLPPEAGLVVLTSQWAKDAGVSRETLVNACSDKLGTLVDLGLVQRVGRGAVTLTPRGAELAAAIQGLNDLTILDQLADRLGVSTRQREREDSIATDRRTNRHRLTPGIVRDLIAGRLATSRVPAILSEVLGSKVVEAMPEVCAALDASAQQRRGRAAMKSLLTSLEKWNGDPRVAVCSPATTSALQSWLAEGEATDVDSEVSLLVEAWWEARVTGRACRGAMHEVPTRIDAEFAHRVEVAIALIRRNVRIARCATAPVGYSRVDVSDHRQAAA